MIKMLSLIGKEDPWMFSVVFPDGTSLETGKYVVDLKSPEPVPDDGLLVCVSVELPMV
jgi:hypothetical protein